MKKIFGIEAEVNITTDEEVVKGIGKGLAKGQITFDEILKEIKPELVKAVKSVLQDKEEKKEK